MSAPEQVRRYSRDGEWVWEGGDWVRLRPAVAPSSALTRPPGDSVLPAEAPFDAAERRLRVAAVVAVLAMIAFVALAMALAVIDSANVDRGAVSARWALDGALRSAAAAQDSVRTQTGRYATEAATLAAAGLRPGAGISVHVLSAGDQRFCLSATSGSMTRYLSSEQRTPAATPCH